MRAPALDGSRARLLLALFADDAALVLSLYSHVVHVHHQSLFERQLEIIYFQKILAQNFNSKKKTNGEPVCNKLYSAAFCAETGTRHRLVFAFLLRIR